MSQSTDTTELYNLLNINKDATEAQIKKAYRDAAKLHHPDKGGSPEKFQQIQEAYEILSNQEKRELYDKGGKLAVERGSADEQGPSIFDIFGGRGGGQRNSGPRRGEDLPFPIKLSYEDIYKGVTKKYNLNRYTLCKGCNGQGGSKLTACSGCKGQGVKVVVQSMGPGMISQSQTTCPDCKGQGKIVEKDCICKDCKGEKVKTEPKLFEVKIPPGAIDGQTFIFKGESHHMPNTLPGDVVFILESKPHNIYTRKQSHLFTNITISLYEALTGFTTYITQLDGTQLELTYNNVISQGTVLKIDEHGFMSSYGPGRGIDHGNMYITVNVQFPQKDELTTPTSTSTNPKDALRQILPLHHLHNSKPIDPTAKIEPITMVSVADMKLEDDKFAKDEQDWKKYQRQQQNTGSSGSGGQYDDDDDGHNGMPHGQPACQPM